MFEIKELNELEELCENTPMPAIVENDFVRKFLLAGNCHCKIENLKSGNVFEYKIQKNKNKSNMYFVNVMSGLGDIYCGYFYVNADLIDYRKGEKGACDDKDIRIQALLWTLNNSRKLPSYVIVQHYGKCSQCGSNLTDTESMSKGLCPLCQY